MRRAGANPASAHWHQLRCRVSQACFTGRVSQACFLGMFPLAGVCCCCWLWCYESTSCNIRSLQATEHYQLRCIEAWMGLEGCTLAAITRASIAILCCCSGWTRKHLELCFQPLQCGDLEDLARTGSTGNLQVHPPCTSGSACENFGAGLGDVFKGRINVQTPEINIFMNRWGLR